MLRTSRQGSSEQVRRRMVATPSSFGACMEGGVSQRTTLFHPPLGLPPDIAMAWRPHLDQLPVFNHRLTWLRFDHRYMTTGVPHPDFISKSRLTAIFLMAMFLVCYAPRILDGNHNPPPHPQPILPPNSSQTHTTQTWEVLCQYFWKTSPVVALPLCLSALRTTLAFIPSDLQMRHQPAPKRAQLPIIHRASIRPFRT